VRQLYGSVSRLSGLVYGGWGGGYNHYHLAVQNTYIVPGRESNPMLTKRPHGTPTVSRGAPPEVAWCTHGPRS